MKHIYIMIILLLLSSCTDKWEEMKTKKEKRSQKVINQISKQEEIESKNNDKKLEKEIKNLEQQEQKAANQIKNELKKLDINQENKSKTVKIDAPYKNPKLEVDMKIEYSLDSQNKIEKINISATNDNLVWVNKQAQALIWKTIEEAKQAYFAGSSLTSEAFRNAIK